MMPMGAETASAADGGAVNLIVNGDFENDTASWKSGTVWDASKSTITAVSDDVHGGSKALKVTDRKSTDAGAIQSLNGKVTKGESYTGSMWIKSTEDATFNFTICSGNGSGCGQIASAAVKAGAWTEIKGTAALGGNGDYSNPSLVIETVYGTGKTGDFIVDDVTLTGKTSEPVVRPAGTAKAAKQVGNSNPIIDYWYGADPWAMEYNGRVYVYTTGDATKINEDGSLTYDYEYDADGNIKDNSFADVKTINVLSTDDMVNWRNEGYIRVAGDQGIAKWAGNSWAPAVTHKTIDGKEKFFLYFANGASGIGVLTADSPVGPWKDERGSLLIKWGTQASSGVTWLFDPAVFTDSDGTGYLYYGGGVPDGQKEHPNTARVIQLGDDMISTVGDAKTIDAPAMFEDSGIAKIGDTYYYSYCTNFSHENVIDGNKIGYGNIAYMTSKSPMGPFTYQGEIMDNPSKFFSVGGNNHHAMVQLGNSWYMVYHAQTVAKELTDGGNLDKARGYRNTHVDPITINKDGSIAPITMTYKGLDQVKNLDAYPEGGISASTIAWDSGIQDAYDTKSGVRVIDLTSDNADGQKLGNINDGEWTSLANVDFGKAGAKSITVNAAAKVGGNIEVRLDSNDTEPVATVKIPAGDGSAYADYTAALSGVTGVHNVFFTFKATQADKSNPELFDIKTYTFAKADPEPTVVPVSGVSVSLERDAVKVGESVLAKASVSPENVSDKSVSWSSSDEKVAKVDASGRVTAVGAGAATITATAKDGSGVSGFAKLTVSADSSEKPGSGEGSSDKPSQNPSDGTGNNAGGGNSGKTPSATISGVDNTSRRQVSNGSLARTGTSVAGIFGIAVVLVAVGVVLAICRKRCLS
ncbi:family 43 glycosylhydrolase [Bifidobacterium primatium]|nr:family 43 glycosylhydrolase [Bifidobacterium primatium]